MLQQFLSKYLTFLILVPFVKARFHKFSQASTSSVRYTDFLAYYEDTSTMQCLALCDGRDSCVSINYNLDNGRCELTPHLPRIQSPVPSAETNWRVYYNDRIIPAIEAWQGTTLGPHSASLAIDGNRDNNDIYRTALNCAHTRRKEAYWAMEFEYVAEVEFVIIYFRNNYKLNDRNENLRLLISTTRQDSDKDIGTDCAYFAGPPTSLSIPTTVKCTQPVTGKFLKIILNKLTVLTLCEVEVYSV